MKRHLGFLSVLLLVIAANALAQFTAPPKPCKVRITVTDDLQQKIRDLTVELQDSVGLAAAGTSKLTDSDGRVEFDSFAGRVYRLRITGAEIFPYEGEFEISRSETFHSENVRVKMRPPVGADNAAPGPPVPSVRLKIPGAAQKEYEKGNKASEKGDWKAAVDAYRDAIQLYPDYDLAYNALGVALSSLGDTQGAKQAFEKALAITPEYAMAGRNLARILIAEQDWKRSDEVLRKSLQIEPINAWALTNAAYAQLQLKDPDSAVLTAQKVHMVPHTGFESAHFIAGLALEQLGRPDEARTQYDVYLKEAPTGQNAGRAQEAIARLSKP